MRFIIGRLVLAGFVVFAGRFSAAESVADAAARAGLTVESLAQGTDIGIVIAEDPATHDRWVSIYRRSDGGTWQLDRREPLCGRSASSDSSSASLATVEASLDARLQNFTLVMPVARSLSDGMVRETQDQIRSWVRRMRAAKSPSDVYRDIQRPFEALISDIGWIDAPRFGIPTACEAAAIVELSGNRRLMEAALPIMEKSLKNAEGGEVCYSRALKAYQTLSRAEGHQ